MFSKFDLKITIEFSLPKIDFLDVELDLVNDSYAPFRKLNSKPRTSAQNQTTLDMLPIRSQN